MRKQRGDRGFTLIEIIVFIIVGSLFVPLAFIAFSHALRDASKPEDYTKARLIAEQAQELTRKMGFAQLNAVADGNPRACTTITGWPASADDVSYTCTWTPGRTGLPAGIPPGQEASYVRIDVTVTTPQNNSFAVSGLVTQAGR